MIGGHAGAMVGQTANPAQFLNANTAMAATVGLGQTAAQAAVTQVSGCTGTVGTHTHTHTHARTHQSVTHSFSLSLMLALSLPLPLSLSIVLFTVFPHTLCCSLSQTDRHTHTLNTHAHSLYMSAAEYFCEHLNVPVIDLYIKKTHLSGRSVIMICCICFDEWCSTPVSELTLSLRQDKVLLRHTAVMSKVKVCHTTNIFLLSVWVRRRHKHIS